MAKQAHRPTDEQRKMARMLSGFGIPQDQIAAEIGVTLPTLHKYYREDLDAGMRQANGKVVQNLFKIATGTTPQAVSAAIFWTKVRMGWSEKQQVELTGKDGGPVEVSVESARDRVKQRIDRLVAALPSLPRETARDLAETEAAEDF